MDRMRGELNRRIVVWCVSALWLGALALPAAAQSTAPAKAPIAPAAVAQVPQADTTALAREAQGWLIDLLRTNTTNPPGNEDAAARYIAGILTKEGLTPEVLTIAPGRSAVVARLRSTAMADPSRAFLLVGHLDVVGVDRPKWTVDPFGGVVKDGYVYGRGAIDDKGPLVANLAAFIALKRSGLHLNRDVIFLATADEEGGGDASIKMLISRYWDKFAAGFAINEGGLAPVKNGKLQYMAIQASEKVPENVKVVARGNSGHASLPTKGNAVVHLAAAVEKIGNYSAPAHFTTVVRRYFEQIAPLENDDIGKWIRSLDTADRGDHAQRVVSDASPLWNAMLRDTIAPTELSGGIRANVIPGEAWANLNIRLLPGDSIEALLGDLTKLVADPQIRFVPDPNPGLVAPPSSLETELYGTISKAAHEEFPGAAVLPFMSPGATDSAQLRLHNVQAYGLMPFPLSDEDFGRMHGDDERLPLASFAKGVDFITRIVEQFAAGK